MSDGRRAGKAARLRPTSARKRWVWEQYDHVILGNTVQRPGGDAAVVRVEDGPKGLALTTDVTPRYCEADPFEGGKQAVAECLAQSDRGRRRGRSPSPTTSISAIRSGPRSWASSSAASAASREACRALDFPVVSGNVSLYNETNGRGDPADADDRRRRPARRFHEIGDARLQGAPARRSCWSAKRTGWLGQSMYLREICGREEGAPPPVDLAAEKRNGDFVRALIGEGAATRGARHLRRRPCWSRSPRWRWPPASARRSTPRRRRPAHAFWFGEDQARYVVTVPAGAGRRGRCRASSRPACRWRGSAPPAATH